MRLRVAGGQFHHQAGLSGRIFHPVFQQEMNYRADVVPDDPDGQVEATIRLMRGYKDEDAASREIQAEAQQISGSSANEMDMVCSVWSTTKGKIGFLRDEVASAPLDFLSRTYSDGGIAGNSSPIIEVLIRPRDMASMKVARYGDCDDFSMYAASLLTALGIPNSFVTLAGDDANPSVFSHVYVAAYPLSSDGSGRRVRVPIDASHGGYCGWEAPNPYARKREWGGPNDGVGDGISFPCLLGIAALVTLAACLTGVLK